MMHNLCKSFKNQESLYTGFLMSLAYDDKKDYEQVE